ncbi:hypothetical protein EMCRGX_G017861 [Ephydatia muelleri]
MEHIKPPPEMDFASSDGTSVAETWRKWRQSMELFLTLAMTGKTEREQCSAFLYIIGPAGRDIYNTFNVSDQDKNKISILFQKFKGYCKPKQNVTVERYRFNTRSQQEGESIDQYVTALKLMTRNCAFGTLEEELIRDRIVCGVSSEKIKERLLRERDLTFHRPLSSKGVSTLTQKEEEEEHSDADELVVGTLNAKQTVEMGINECFASFRVQDRVIKFKIDTGSQVNIMPLIKPVISPPRNQPVTIRDRLKTELNKMESMGVIVAVEEPTDWVNSLVVVEKPKTKQLRICLDPRPLNKAIMREHFQLPTLDDIATRLHGAKVFSKLDANHGYWQIPLDRASQLLTTFNTPFGRYCYTRLPFGISSAQEVFQKRMYQLFGDLPGVETDIDDMLIHGRTEEEHQQRLTAVLKRCQEVHLTLNKEKCQFGVPQVTYLGHCISADGITPDENRVKAILAMPPPKDKKGVERLLGTLNYVSKFVPNMSTVTEHIRVLLGKDVPFVWTWEQEAAFENVKKLLSTAPVLAFYDVKQPVTVSCDASQTGLGAVLLQQERPVAYISRALSDTEQRYAQIEKELLAVVFAFEKFNQYVYGRTVSVQSDHKPLESILKKPLHHAPPRLQRMLLRLQKYDFILSYKPGKEMYIADTLSRAYTTDTTVGEMETELAEAVHLVVSNVPASSKRMREIREATAKDTVLLALRNMIRDGWPDSRSAVASDLQQYWNFREELSEASGILWKGEKVIVPKALRQDMLQKIHAGHMGITKCTQRAKEVIFWPGMSQEIANIVQKCQTCREFQASNAKEPMFQEQVPHGPWEMIASDLFHFNGADYLLIVDYYSKFIEVSRLSDTLSKTIITHTKSIFARHGIPQKVRTDNGPQFSSREYKLFAEKWGFDHITTSPLHPQSNGLAERSVQIIKRMLKKSLATGQDVYLNLLELRNTSIGELGSPAQLLMSRRLQTSLPVKPAQLEPKVINPEHVKSILEKNSRQQKKYYDKGSKSLAPLHIGDSVYIQLDKHWSPATITDIADTPRSYIVTTTEGKTYRRNRRHLQQTSHHQQDADNISEYSDYSEESQAQVNEQSHNTDQENQTGEDTEETKVVHDANDEPLQQEHMNAPSDGSEVQYRTRSGRAVREPKRYNDYVRI